VVKIKSRRIRDAGAMGQMDDASRRAQLKACKEELTQKGPKPKPGAFAVTRGTSTLVTPRERIAAL
jgi:hypothetical protein